MLASFNVFIKYFLSVSVILICFVSKLPQIIRVVKSESTNGKLEELAKHQLDNINFCQSIYTGISLFSLGIEVFRLSILLTYNFCYGNPILYYLEYLLILAQQSILFYYVLKFKNLLETEMVLLSMLVYLTIILFMAEVFPRIILDYLIVSKNMNVIFIISKSLPFYVFRNIDFLSST